jgi:hypothetical protein
MNPLDQQFKDRLHDHSVPPPDFVWPKVEAALKEKRRRPFWWWGAGSIALAVLAGATYWWTEAQQTSTLTQHVQQQQGVDKPTNQSRISTAPSALPANGPISADRVTASAANTPAVTTLVHAHSLRDAFTTRQVVPSLTDLTPKDASLAMPEVALLSTNESEDKSLITNNLAGSFALLEEAPIVIPERYDVDKRRMERLPYRTATLSKNNAAAPTLKIKVPKTKPPRKASQNGCYDFESNRTVWLVEVSGGPLLHQRSLTNQSTREFDDYLQQRITTERDGLGFSTAGHVAAIFNGHIKVRTGVRYDQFTAPMTYVDPLSITYDIVSVYNIQTGQTTLDTVDVHFGSAQTRTYNRYGFLDIPLELGYEYRRGRMGVGLQVGASANLLFWKRGSAISPTTGKPARFTPGDSNEQAIYTARTGWSALGSVQLFYHVRPQMRLFAEPSYRRVLQPLTLEGHPLRQQSGMMSLRVGASYIF